ncbi:MAG TPA: EVE domain-containing protein [Nevskiaceae bacterium]|nr:EVE domain-containing protein [Nevskiaceae bacterium]
MTDYWLLKSEPSAFSFEDLQARPHQTEPWDGVRNYQARNLMRDQMRIGDRAFFYHSNCEAPGIVGVVSIASAGYPDPTQFDQQAGHYDPKSSREQPRWFLVDVHFEHPLQRLVSLAELRQHADRLEGFQLLARANRLSVMSVRAAHWHYILELAARPRAV